jgi:hypothetical protein
MIDVLPEGVIGMSGHGFIKHFPGQGKDNTNRFISGKAHSQAIEQCCSGKGSFALPGDYRFDCIQMVMGFVFFH